MSGGWMFGWINGCLSRWIDRWVGGSSMVSAFPFLYSPLFLTSLLFPLFHSHLSSNLLNLPQVPTEDGQWLQRLRLTQPCMSWGASQSLPLVFSTAERHGGMSFPFIHPHIHLSIYTSTCPPIQHFFINHLLCSNHFHPVHTFSMQSPVDNHPLTVF